MNETHQLPCLKRKLVHSALLCIWSVDKQQIRQTQCMELFIVTYQGGVHCQEMLSTDCNHWKVTNIKLNLILQEENYFQLCEKIKVLHKIIINLH